MIQYILLILAIPLGYLCVKATQDEKQIYQKKQYFPLILKILLILATISISQSEQIFLTTAFLLITIHIWHKA
ncbi:MAG: hypothetical protein V1888_03230 [archaeon]